MISKLEIYKSDSLNPYSNLATEKFLLDTVDQDTLRLYLWRNENTAVIGKNQNPWAECNCDLLDAEGGFVARRLSGGGAVFHDKGNLNFTFICNEKNYDVNKHLKVIKKACEFIGITAEISGRNDILTHGKKFSGNAFYHSGGKAYHHGTILISSSTEKIERYLTPKKQKLEAKGVKSVKSRVINLNEIKQDLTPQIMADNMITAAQEIYGLKADFLTLKQNQQIKNNTEIFSSWEYIFGKTLPFSVCLADRFNWGEIQINLNLLNAKITDIKVFTDSLDFSLAEKLEEALLGKEFSAQKIKTRLENTLQKDICGDILSLFESK